MTDKKTENGNCRETADQKLDYILQQALTPQISDEEIEVNLSLDAGQSDRRKSIWRERNMRAGKILKPVAAVAACAVLVVGVGIHKLPDWQTTKQEIASGNIAEVVEQVKNSFTVSVQAAEHKIALEKNKAAALVAGGDSFGSVWGGDPDLREVDYSIDASPVVEGENIEKITYSINHGAFQVYAPEGSDIFQDVKEYKGEMNVGATVSKEIAKKIEKGEKGKYEEKYLTSYTIRPKDQNSKKIDVDICDNHKVSKKTYKKLWGDDNDTSLKEEAEGRNEVLNDLTITCTVTYKDGTTDTFDIAVEEKIMTFEEAGMPEEELGEELIEQGKAIFTVFRLK